MSFTINVLCITINYNLHLPGYFRQQIVSCAGDGMIHFTDLERESTYGQFQFDCHAGTTYEVYSGCILACIPYCTDFCTVNQGIFSLIFYQNVKKRREESWLT